MQIRFTQLLINDSIEETAEFVERITDQACQITELMCVTDHGDIFDIYSAWEIALDATNAELMLIDMCIPRMRCPQLIVDRRVVKLFADCLQLHKSPDSH